MKLEWRTDAARIKAYGPALDVKATGGGVSIDDGGWVAREFATAEIIRTCGVVDLQRAIETPTSIQNGVPQIRPRCAVMATPVGCSVSQ